PRHDWKIVLSIFAVLIIIVFAVSGTVFVRFSMSDTDQEPDSTVSVGTIDRDKLSEVLEYFDRRSLDTVPAQGALVDPSR
ncbi:MAG: hypothetical protein WC767_00840, partial [Candidatus Paceibacterota bacterium]